MNNKLRQEIKESILHYLADDFKGNQALFDRSEGFQNFYGTDLSMVMDRVVNGIWAVKEPSTFIDLHDDNFGAVLNCAIRYCLGRRTYMPSYVIEIISKSFVSSNLLTKNIFFLNSGFLVV